MENKKNEELQSRREFFKKAAKAALPVVGAVVLSSLPIAEAKAQYGCDYNCSGSCSKGCYGGCDQYCQNDCSNTCQTTCRFFCGCNCNRSCSVEAGSQYPKTTPC